MIISVCFIRLSINVRFEKLTAASKTTTEAMPVSYTHLDVYKRQEEGCLSLEGVRPGTRYKEIEVDYLDQNFKKKHGKYTGWPAQIIQHEVDHCNGVVI